MTGSGPRIAISRSAASMPFCSGITAVCGPINGRSCSPTRVDVPQLDAEQRVIDGADARDIVSGLRRPNMGFAAVSFDAQPVLTHRREMRTARDENDIRPGFGERSAVRAADAAGADDRDTHALLLIRRGWLISLQLHGRNLLVLLCRN